MSPPAIEVGAFSWARIQRQYDADAVVHSESCEAEGLRGPHGGFAQLFHAGSGPAAGEASCGPMSSDLRSVTSIDCGRVSWELTEFSGIALRHMRVDRGYQLALDEAMYHAVCYVIVDAREDVVAHWQEAKSWLVAPVGVTADLLGGGGGFELLVGFTRLGNLLGMLDRQEILETQKHLVWIGKVS